MARRNIYSLTTAEWDRVVAALNGIKASGLYDDFTRRHVTAMMTPVRMPGEPATGRNVAHKGPVVLPWHRQLLLEFEAALRTVDSAEPLLELPYWRFDEEGNTWRTRPIWTLIGGNGDPARGNRIQTGPFRTWNSIIYNSTTGAFQARTGIMRQFIATGKLPGPFSNVTYNIPNYDVAPWNETSNTTSSFRAQIEKGHNEVHNGIGGDMKGPASPNDPVFWLMHCNLDRVWAEYQVRRGMNNYQPVSGGPTAHNLDDPMVGLLSTTTTPAMVLDFRALNATYDTVAP